MKKALIVIAIVTTFLLFGTQAMAYDSILFPYYKSGGGDMTFVQILNAAAVGTPVVGTTQGRLNFYYNYNTPAELCVHYDDKGRTTRNDIMLFEVTSQVAGQLLPGDTTSSAPKLTATPPVWGWLIVEQNKSDFATGLEGTLHGQAIVVNVNAGTAFAYNAMNDPDETDGTNEFYYNSNDDQMLTFLPETLASTVFYLFPVTGEDLAFDVTWTFVDVGDNPFSSDEGVYDNNESLKSGLKTFPVGCYCPGDDPSSNYGYGCADDDLGPVLSNNFFFTLQQMMTGAQYNAVKGTGGWMGIYWWDYGYSYKIVTSSVLGKPMSGLLYEPEYDYISSYTK